MKFNKSSKGQKRSEPPGRNKFTSEPKKGSHLGGDGPKLSPVDQEVLFLLAHEKLTPGQAAIRKNVSKSAIYKVRRKLIKMGVINVVNDVVQKEGGHLNPGVNHQIRLHNEQYHIKIAWCDDKYIKRCREGSCRLMIDGQTVMLYRNVIEVYSNKSFYGKDPDDADFKAVSYWLHFFTRLEHSTNTILVKREKQNITRVRAEYAETGNELATQAIKEHEKVRVCGQDGKTWLIIDNSFGFNELETVHPNESKLDMKNTVQPFFNDLRDNFEEAPRMSQILNAIQQLAIQNKETASGLNAVVQLIKNQNAAQQPVSNELGRPDYCG